jgi:hypothetical protein
VPAASPVPAALVVLSLAGTLTACSDKPATVTPSDSSSSEKVDALEREIRAMRDEQGALRGTTLSSQEGLALASQLKDLKNQLAELQARNAALAAALPAGAAGGTGTATDAGSGGSSTASPLPPIVGMPIPSDLSAPIPEDTLKAFRRISDEVDKIRTAEQQAKRLKDDLTRAGVSLTPEQEAALAKVQSTYTEKIRELYRGGGGATDADRAALVAQRDAIRAAYEAEIRTVVPAADADKIIETVSRGGFRGGGAGRNLVGGGMNGMGG